MSTRTRVLQLLRGPQASRIRFAFPNRGTTITINRMTFEQVARAIEGRRMTIAPPTSLPPGAGAMQNPAINEIQVARPLGRWDEATILHECTHAFFDLNRTSLSATDEEAAAYVVTALYCRMTGLKQDRWGQITQHARPVVEAILRHYAQGRPGIPTVEEGAWDDLRVFISFHPLYFNGTAGFPRQVLPSLFGSGDYVNNG